MKTMTTRSIVLASLSLILLLSLPSRAPAQTVTITFAPSTAAEWYYVSESPSQVAEWYYFTDQPSGVAKWVYFASKPDIADVVLTSELRKDTPWLYIGHFKAGGRLDLHIGYSGRSCGMGLHNQFPKGCRHHILHCRSKPQEPQSHRFCARVLEEDKEC